MSTLPTPAWLVAEMEKEGLGPSQQRPLLTGLEVERGALRVAFNLGVRFEQARAAEAAASAVAEMRALRLVADSGADERDQTPNKPAPPDSAA